MGEVGEVACLDNCAMNGLHSIFSFHKMAPGETLPPADPAVVDVALLDMHHGWPNLGHNSIVQAVREAACDFEGPIRHAGLRLRVFSFDVRKSGLLPEPPGGRFQVYLGTGGPGHIDPHKNDGVAAFSQSVLEDPSWEPRAFHLFDAIRRDATASFIAVCHSFGILCRWSGVATPVERGAAKGGKSAGIVENALTGLADDHPWFSGFVRNTGGSRFTAIDSRLFDLIPNAERLAEFSPLSYETTGRGGAVGEALTGVEFARDEAGVMPRMFGVNHHPEIMDAGRQKLILETLWEKREVTRAWYDERMAVVAEGSQDPQLAQALALTTGFMFVWPLRFHLIRNLRQRAEALNRSFEMHEDDVLEKPIGDRRRRPRSVTAPSPAL